MIARKASGEPTFNLPVGASSDFYLSREVNDSNDGVNNGKVVKKHGLWRYPYLTRRTGDSLVGTNEEITSSELRHGKTAGKTKLGNASSSGTHDFEFSAETFDDQFEGVMNSEWVRWKNDGESNLVTKRYKTAPGFIHVNGDEGCYNQVANGKRVTSVPLFYTENEKGDEADPFGLIKISEENMGAATRGAATNKLGKFIVHELHLGEKPKKYSFISRIPVNGDTVRYQNYKHCTIGQMNLNFALNAIVTGSFSVTGSNNPEYFTQTTEAGKKRMADEMAEKKDVATGTGDTFYSTDSKDAAEKFLKAVRDTTESTVTEQFTALDGFLFLNGHQTQFATDLTLDINKNVQSKYALFVKNAIATIEPKVDITGNITVYFTDGEVDSKGVKFGADDVKNLSVKNKDVEILFAVQDKEDPESLYIFQIFKTTLSSPQETKSAEDAITLGVNYTSYDKMAIRALRCAIPKVRTVALDGDSMYEAAIGSDETAKKSFKVTLIPNVPLDATDEAMYVTESDKNYAFKEAEIYVNTILSDAATVSNAKINTDGTISATVTLPDAIARGDSILVKVTVNGTECEGVCDVLPDIPYIRMGTGYKAEKYTSNAVELKISTAADGDKTLDILKASTTAPSSDEDFLVFVKDWTNRTASPQFTYNDIVVDIDDDSVLTYADGVLSSTTIEGTTNVTISSLVDSDVKMTFAVTTVA